MANAVRRVNAEWSRAGEPAVPELRQLYLNLQRNLYLADVSGDGQAATRAIRAWQVSALAAILEAADGVAE